jgi:hypothetical protein
MPEVYDPGEDTNPDPVIGVADVIGLYPAHRAAAAAKWTKTIDSHGNTDDD